MDTIDIKEAVKKRRLKEAEAHLLKKRGPGGTGISSGFISDCLNANELGDGLLYAALNKDRFLYNKNTNEWMKWAGHHWEVDYFNQAVSGVEYVCEAYLSEAHRLVDLINTASKKKDNASVKQYRDLQARIYKRVKRLRTERGRQNTLKFAHTNPSMPLSVRADDLGSKTLVARRRKRRYRFVLRDYAPRPPGRSHFNGVPYSIPGDRSPGADMGVVLEGCVRKRYRNRRIFGPIVRLRYIRFEHRTCVSASDRPRQKR